MRESFSSHKGKSIKSRKMLEDESRQCIREKRTMAKRCPLNTDDAVMDADYCCDNNFPVEKSMHSRTHRYPMHHHHHQIHPHLPYCTKCCPSKINRLSLCSLSSSSSPSSIVIIISILVVILSVSSTFFGAYASPQNAGSSPYHGWNVQQSQQSFTPPSTADLDWLLREAIGEVKKVFESRMQKFDDFFRELLKSSKRDFHQMFLQTYGLLYERNSYIFTDMFQELERYYTSGGISLDEVLDSFFHRLYSKMFQVLNAQYTFDEVYLRCVSEKMEELKPFGDIPKKLKIEVRRAFVATRTFVLAMAAAADVVGRVGDVPLSSECSSALSRFSSCPSCASGHRESPRLCPSVCPSSFAKCLWPHMSLNEEWNRFLQSLLLLLSRLETSFNIESVVDPIDIKISEAIMNFQENGIQVSNKLFDQCGKPRIGKRDTHVAMRDARFGGPLPTSHHRHRGSLTPGVVDSVKYNRESGQSIDRLLTDVKRKVKKTRDYWINLPDLICSHQKFSAIMRPQLDGTGAVVSGQSPFYTITCWNGTTIVSESLTPQLSSSSSSSLSPSSFAAISPSHSHSLHNRGHNSRRGTLSDQPTSSRLIDPLLRSQVVKLKTITKKLNFAYNGLDVDWEESNYESDLINTGGGREGSGSGDGHRPTISDDEDDDDDDEDKQEGGQDGQEGGIINQGPPKIFNPEDDSAKSGNDLSSFSSTTVSSTTSKLDKGKATKSPVVTLTAKSSGQSCVSLGISIITAVAMTSFLCLHW